MTQEQREIVDQVVRQSVLRIKNLAGVNITLTAREKKALQGSVQDVAANVSTALFVPIERLKNGTRKREVVEARHIAMSISRDVYKFGTLTSIGLYFGGRHHSTVIHACELVSDLVKTDRDFKLKYDTALQACFHKIGTP